MIKITLPADEQVNSETNEFLYLPEITLQLEHSLLSIHKWEAKTHKPFYNQFYKKNSLECLEYIRCMTIKPSDLSLDTYTRLTNPQIEEILQYVDDPMTATVFSKIKSEKSNNGSFITAEIIYYWMIQLNIPLEFEKRHINQLLTLIEVIRRKSGNESKMSQEEAAMRRHMLNEQRKAKYHTNG